MTQPKTLNMHMLSFLAVVLTCSLTSAATESATLTLDVKQGGAIGDGVADDTAAIQNALTGGQRTVVIPPGTYKVSAALTVDSGTAIKADPKAIIRLADRAGTNVGVFLLTNRDAAGGNTKIAVEGGVWDGNNEHNPRGREGDPNGYTGTAINFINVRQLVLRNLTIRNPEAFSIRLGAVEDFVVEDIRFDHTVIRPNQDGVHVGGFCQRGVIRKLRALTPRTTNDDMVALNADDATDRVINLGMKRGPIRDITVENLRAEDAYTFVRLLSFKELIENVTISDVSGGCRVHAINLDRWRFPAGGGNIRNVTLRNFTVRKLAGGDLAKWSNQAPLIPIQSSVHGLRIENFRREPADDLPAPTLVVDNGQHNRLSLEGATGESTGNKIIVSRGGFSLLTVDSPTNSNSSAAQAGACGPSRFTVRDHLWIFTVYAGGNNLQTQAFPAGNAKHFIDDYAPGGSRMTPAEGAFWLGVPNLLLIRSKDTPPLPSTEVGRAKTTFEQYATSFQPLDRVVWSVVGGGGEGGMNELPPVLDLAKRYPNIRGVFLDDFVRPDKPVNGRMVGRPSLQREDLGRAREQMKAVGRPMEVWVTLYTHEINESRKTAAPTYRGCVPPLVSFLDQFDVLTLWTWNSDELRELEENLVALEKIAPKKARIALGIYLWDFHNRKPVPVELMKHQCDLGLKWLKEGRISDMIFLANTVLDVGMPSAEFSREWIKKHGDEKLNR